jgi:hypothetical protein
MDRKDFPGHRLLLVGLCAIFVVTIIRSMRHAPEEWTHVEIILSILEFGAAVAIATGSWIDWRARRRYIRERIHDLERHAPRPSSQVTARE